MLFSYKVIEMIRQAKKEDIQALEAMYKARVLYNDAHDIHQWNLQDVTWSTLSKNYTIEDFYVVEVNNEICASVCFVDYDPQYWPNIKKGSSYFLHKICVNPKHAKQGYADQLISYFKERGKQLGYLDVRLDVRFHKDKLRAMYERHGFRLVEERKIFDDYRTALYLYKF